VNPAAPGSSVAYLMINVPKSIILRSTVEVAVLAVALSTLLRKKT
jgi:hypothetical protein